MLDRNNLSRFENILSINNDNVDILFINDILKYYRDGDLTLLFLSILDLTESIDSAKEIIPDVLKFLKEEKRYDLIELLAKQRYNTVLLKNILQTIKDNPKKEEDLFDSYSDNQMVSKIALIDAVNRLSILNKNSNVAIWGSWYGSILIPKLSPNINKIVAIDLDSEPLQIAKNRLFNDLKNVDYICDDVFKTYRDIYLQTNLIINTSCEHMSPMKDWKWFGEGAMENDTDTSIFRNPKLPNECFFAFQSNNMFGIEGHVNCVNSLQEFKDQLPKRAEVLYEEEVEDTRGTRYMLVGKFIPL